MKKAIGEEGELSRQETMTMKELLALKKTLTKNVVIDIAVCFLY